MDIKAFNTMVGRNIRFLREELGLSVEDLAKLAQGLSRPLITKIENNRTEDSKHKKQIAMEHIEMLAHALRVPLDVILENNEPFNERIHKLSIALDKLQINQQTLAIAERLLIEVSGKGPRQQAKVLQLIAGLDYQRGLIESSIAFYQHALNIAMQSLDYEMINSSRYGMASAYFVLGKYEMVVKLIQENLDSETEAKNRGRDLYLLGMAYTIQRVWDKGIEALTLAIEELKNTDMRLLEGRCYLALGEIYKNTRQFAISIESVEQAQQIANDTQDGIGEIYSLKTLGEIFLEQKEREVALTCFEKALEKAQQIGTFRKMEILKMEFYIALCNKDFARMKACLEEIEKIEISPVDLAELYKETARLATQLERYIESIEFYEKAIQKLEK